LIQSNRNQPEAQNNTAFLSRLPAVCKTGVTLPCYFSWLNADGVISIFVSAAVAGEDRPIAAMHVVLPAALKTNEKPRENIAGPRKEKRTIGRRKTAAGMV